MTSLVRFAYRLGACCAILEAIRSRTSRITAALILLTCATCPLVEIFDHWDHTIQTGNDTEYALVVLTLCVGVTFSFSRFIPKSRLARIITRIVFTPFVECSLRSAQFSFTSLLSNALSLPPLELRI